MLGLTLWKVALAVLPVLAASSGEHEADAAAPVQDDLSVEDPSSEATHSNSRRDNLHYIHNNNNCLGCNQIWCDLTMCFDDNLGPSHLVFESIEQAANHQVDGGRLVSWERNSPAQYCNGGFRKGHGLYKIWRVACDIEPATFNMNFKSKYGSLSSRCYVKTGIKVSHC